MSVIFELDGGLRFEKSAKVSKYFKIFCEQSIFFVKIAIQIFIEIEENNKTSVTPPLGDSC